MKPVGSSSTMAQASAKGGRSSAHGKAVELFTHSLCPYAQRVEMALAEKEVQHEVVSIDLNRKPSWYRSVNPRMLVPALRWNGNVVVESLAICRFVDESFEGPPLMPDEAGLRDRAEELLDNCDVVVSAGLQAVKGKDGRYWGIGTKFDERDIEAFERNLAPLLEQLQEKGGPFLMGQQLTLADLAYLPFIERFTVVMDQFMGYSPRMLGGGKLGDWMDSCRERHSLQGTWTDPVKLRKAYQKYMSLDFFDYHSLTKSDL